MHTDIPDWLARKVAFEGRHADIPETTQYALKMWVLYAQSPGGFVEAVLRNDLHDAFNLADDDNQRAMFLIVDWLHNECPTDCWLIRSSRRDEQREELYKFKGLVVNPNERTILDEDDGLAP